MKIVILNGSPRLNGNTRTILKEIENCLIENFKESSIDFIDMSLKTIKPCDACDACIALEGKCVHKDDTNGIMSMITTADTIIFGTPVYWWGVSTQLKSIIDKFYTWQALKYDVPNKKIGIVSVGGAKLGDPQYKLISDQFKYISNFLKWDIKFDVSYSAYEVGDINKDSEALESSRRLFLELLK